MVATAAAAAISPRLCLHALRQSLPPRIYLQEEPRLPPDAMSSTSLTELACSPCAAALHQTAQARGTATPTCCCSTSWPHAAATSCPFSCRTVHASPYSSFSTSWNMLAVPTGGALNSKSGLRTGFHGMRFTTTSRPRSSCPSSCAWLLRQLKSGPSSTYL